MKTVKYISTLFVALILGFLGYNYFEEQTIKNSNNATKTQNDHVVAENTNSTYKDGTYSAGGNYMSPEGKEELGIKITLANNIIKQVEFFNQANDDTSKRWQDTFAKGLNAQVAGRNINTVNLDNVNGSSLTPIGFNSALAKIKLQAKS